MYLLQVVLMDYNLTGIATNVDSKLEELYTLLQGFCKRTKTPLHMDGLTKNILGFQRDADYPAGLLVS